MNTSWKRQAACENETAVMFAHQCKSTCSARKPCDNDPRALVAKSFCHDCPVISECRFWAIVIALPEGVAGGLTVKERRRVRRELNQAGFPYNDFKPNRTFNDDEDDMEE